MLVPWDIYLPFPHSVRCVLLRASPPRRSASMTRFLSAYPLHCRSAALHLCAPASLSLSSSAVREISARVRNGTGCWFGRKCNQRTRD